MGEFLINWLAIIVIYLENWNVCYPKTKIKKICSRITKKNEMKKTVVILDLIHRVIQA